MAITVDQNNTYIQPYRGAVTNNTSVKFHEKLAVFFPGENYYAKIIIKKDLCGHLGSVYWTETVSFNSGHYWNGCSIGYVTIGSWYIDGDYGYIRVTATLELYSDSNYTNKVFNTSVSNLCYIKGNVYEYNHDPSITQMWDIWDNCCTAGEELIDISDDTYIWKKGRMWKCKNAKLRVRKFWPAGPSYSSDFSDSEDKRWEHWKDGDYYFYNSSEDAWVTGRWCKLEYDEYDTYQTYPGLHLVNSMQVSAETSKSKYVLFSDFAASLNVSEDENETINEIKDNFGSLVYASDDDVIYEVPIGQLPEGNYSINIGVIGEYNNSNLSDTVDEQEIAYQTTGKYELGELVCEIYGLKVRKSDLSEINIYDWTFEYQNGTCSIIPNYALEAGDVLVVNYREYAGSCDFEITYSEQPITYYAEDADSIAAYGKRLVKEIFLPITHQSEAVSWAQKYLAANSSPIQNKEFKILQEDQIVMVGDEISIVVDEESGETVTEKVVECKITIGNGELIEETIKTGSVEKILSELL
ncbi:hypothetical protein HNP93_000990 [Methanococcus maripaludis]|uniref:Uncharacterized protein n=1 Tax=Methanococcus maripaludis TaxID=39152 RepID=A0A7J9PA72_METMI|nr:hypothetical protein [Methanococcus maripaludis]MBA2858289.1 hypothetical protein [Methanococcus maripaludis]